MTQNVRHTQRTPPPPQQRSIILINTAAGQPLNQLAQKNRLSESDRNAERGRQRETKRRDSSLLPLSLSLILCEVRERE